MQTKKQDAPAPFEQWAIVELFGHKRLAGLVREVTIAGAGFVRIDVPGRQRGEVVVSPMYQPAAIYGITPCTEQTARLVARQEQPEPVTQYDVRRMLPAKEAEELDEVEPF